MSSAKKRSTTEGIPLGDYDMLPYTDGITTTISSTRLLLSWPPCGMRRGLPSSKSWPELRWAGELKLGKRCTTKQELLTFIVTTLEEAFYRFAKVHDPDLDVEHAHALELHELAEKVVGRGYGLRLEVGERRELFGVCRALRNMEAHHNSFSKEAIQGRKDGGPVHCMYDEEEDPYKALTKDAERVALMIGDEGAAREIRLALWAADVGLARY